MLRECRVTPAGSEGPTEGKKKSPLFEIDTTSLPDPEYVGFANVIDVLESGDIVELAFYEQGAHTDDVIPVFRAILAVDDLLVTFWPTITKFMAGLGQVYPNETDNLPPPAGRRMPLDRDVTAAAASAIMIARSGIATTIAFHYVTPRSLHLGRLSGDIQKHLEIKPVATVSTTARAIYRMLVQLRPITQRVELERPDLKRLAKQVATQKGL
jgi:hypothetical protein